MLRDGIIEPSKSPFASPVVLVRKPDNSWRFCVDYRKLNLVTTKDVYPLPRIEDALSRLEGSKYFSIMDMQSGYWQVQMSPEDKHKTAFITADGLYQFRVMPFGLTNAPSTFQRMMDVLLAGLKWNICLVYLDDIVIFSETVSEHLVRLEAVLRCLKQANLKLKLSKCSFLFTSLRVLGYVVSGLGLSPEPSKVAAVQAFPIPRTLKQVQSFVGLCSYYRRFVKNFAVIAKPLTNLTKKKQPFLWSDDQQNSFETLKTALITPPILAHPCYDLPMEIHCDACDYGIGAVLVQRQNGEERVLAYASRLLDPAERNYTTTEKECLALVCSVVKKFKIYIWGIKIKVVTDHHSLCWLMRKTNLSGRLARWSLELQDLDIDIVYRSGRLHQDADALSRNPVDPPESESGIPMLFINLPMTASPNIAVLQSKASWWKPIIVGLRELKPGKRTRRLIKHFVLIDGILYHRIVRQGHVYHRLCLPPSLVIQVLLACHDDVTAGHLGVTRTLHKIHKRFYWPKMSQQVSQYVKSCQDCQTKKGLRTRPAGLLQPLRPKQPFERIGIDLIGPFPRSTSGNKHVIIAVDYLTKWVIAKAVPTKNTFHIVDFFVRRIVLQHGAPVDVISDRGASFKAEFAEELFKALQSNHLVTTAYHPQCNGLVERFNHTFAEMLSMFVNSKHNDWDEVIDHVVFAYNTSRHESIGVSPFYMLYGREARLPIDVALGNNPNSNVSTNFAFIQRLPLLREQVKRRLIIVQQKQKERYDRSHKYVSFDVGSLVWVFRPDRKVGLSEKLLHRWHGPFKVIRKVSHVNYLVTSIRFQKNSYECVHVSRLKPFIHRSPFSP